MIYCLKNLLVYPITLLEVKKSIASKACIDLTNNSSNAVRYFTHPFCMQILFKSIRQILD